MKKLLLASAAILICSNISFSQKNKDEHGQLVPHVSQATFEEIRSPLYHLRFEVSQVSKEYGTDDLTFKNFTINGVDFSCSEIVLQTQKGSAVNCIDENTSRKLTLEVKNVFVSDPHYPKEKEATIALTLRDSMGQLIPLPDFTTKLY